MTVASLLARLMVVMLVVGLSIFALRLVTRKITERVEEVVVRSRLFCDTTMSEAIDDALGLRQISDVNGCCRNAEAIYGSTHSERSDSHL